MPVTISIEKPANFHFRNTVCSHGWYDLAPYEFDETAGTLGYVFRDRYGNVAYGTIFESDGSIKAALPNKKIKADQVEHDVRHLLRLDTK